MKKKHKGHEDEEQDNEEMDVKIDRVSGTSKTI